MIDTPDIGPSLGLDEEFNGEDDVRLRENNDELVGLEYPPDAALRVLRVDTQTEVCFFSFFFFL